MPFFQVFRSKPTTHIQNTTKSCWLYLQNVLYTEHAHCSQPCLKSPSSPIRGYCRSLLNYLIMPHLWHSLHSSWREASHFQGKNWNVLLAYNVIYDLFHTPTAIPSAPLPPPWPHLPPSCHFPQCLQRATCGGCSVARSCLTLRPHELRHTRHPCPSPHSKKLKKDLLTTPQRGQACFRQKTALLFHLPQIPSPNISTN